MKKLFESDLISRGESAEAITVYEITEEESFELDELSQQGFLDLFDLVEEINPAPGAIYHRYSFNLDAPFLFIHETTAYNI